MTISYADLDSAVSEGLISDETAAALRLHALKRQGEAALATPPPESGEAEHFRLLSGFNDVFVVVALSVLLAALTWMADELAGTGNLPVQVLAIAVPALASWLLSLYFVKRRRLALPGLALAAWFSLGISLGLAFLLFEGKRRGLVDVMVATVWPGLSLVATALLHGAVFRVPFNAALVAGGVLLMFRALSGPFETWHQVLLGLLLLGAAVALDASDRLRRSLRSDAAFWLHLVAAPVLVAGLFGLLGSTATPSMVLAALGVYAALVLVSLVLDRRAPLVSGLAYLLGAIAALFNTAGAVGDRGLALAGSALAIALALLLLAAGWRWARSLVLAPLPQRAKDWLPPA